jgi:hypothetical protein
MKSKSKKPKKATPTAAKAGQVCIICGKPATRVLDGDPSCDEHLELVYEDQVEKYTASHLKEDEWLEKV